MTDVRSPAVQKALQILRLLATEDRGLTLSEIAGQLALAKSSVHGLLQTMEMEGFVEKDERDNSYRVGLAAFEVGSSYVQRSQPFRLFSIHARTLAATCDQVVYLAIADRDHVVTIAKEEGNGPVRCVVPLGGRYPLWSSAAGKVFLASYSGARLQLSYQSLVDSGMVPRELAYAQFQKEVLAVRINGYAMAEEAFGPGTRSIAAPIRDHSQKVVAAIGTVAPTVTVDDQATEALIEAITRTALDLSQRLGYRPEGRDSLAAGRHEAGALIGGFRPIEHT